MHQLPLKAASPFLVSVHIEVINVNLKHKQFKGLLHSYKSCDFDACMIKNFLVNLETLKWKMDNTNKIKLYTQLC